MDTLLFIGVLAGSVVLIVRGEIGVRRVDRTHAALLPLKIDAARTEYKLERRAEALREHCTPEDLKFLADNGSEFARRRILAIEAAKQPDPVPEPPRRYEDISDQIWADFYKRSQVNKRNAK